MTMSKFGIGSAVVLGAALATATFSSAFAADSNSRWYIGLNAGQSDFDDPFSKSGFDSFYLTGIPLVSYSSSLVKTDTTVSVFGGYQFSRYFAVEASYTNLGKERYKASGQFDPPGPLTFAPFRVNSNFGSKGPTLAVVGAIPLGDMFDLHARLGVLFAKTEAFTEYNFEGAPFQSKDSASSQDFFYGLGGSLKLGQQWSLSLDWHQYKDVGDKDKTGEIDINTITLGAAIHF